jgi:hypothetical protein
MGNKSVTLRTFGENRNNATHFFLIFFVTLIGLYADLFLRHRAALAASTAGSVAFVVASTNISISTMFRLTDRQGRLLDNASCAVNRTGATTQFNNDFLEVRVNTNKDDGYSTQTVNYSLVSPG